MARKGKGLFLSLMEGNWREIQADKGRFRRVGGLYIVFAAVPSVVDLTECVVGIVLTMTEEGL